MRRSQWLDKRDESLWSEVEALKDSDLAPSLTAISKKLHGKYQLRSPEVPATITWENLRSITLNGFKLNIKITDEDIELVPTNGESNGEQTASQTAEPINN